MTDAKFIPGLFFKDKHENAPDFVICKGSIKVADLVQFLSTVDGEWVNFDLKRSKDGKPYAAVDDWKPQGGQQQGQRPSRGQPPARQQQRQAPPQDDFNDPIPW